MGAFILICIIAYLFWLFMFRDLYMQLKYRKETNIQISSDLTSNELAIKLKNDLNYPALKDVTCSEIGEISINGKYGHYSLIIENNLLHVEKINGKEITRANAQQLEEKECIKAYIEKLFNPDATVNPQKKYKKLTATKRNRFLIFVAFFLFGAFAVLEDGGLDAIKSNGISNSYLSQYSETVTIGEAFNEFFADPQWTKYENGAQKLVDFRGSCYYDGDLASVIITFSLNENSFAITNITVNGYELPYLLYDGLLNSIYYG